MATAKSRKPGDFLAQAKAATRQEKVDLPELDCDVYARTLSAANVRRITEACLLPGKKLTDTGDVLDDDRLTLAIVGASIVDVKGVRLIDEGRESEIDDMPNSIKTALQLAALRVNRMGAPDSGNG